MYEEALQARRETLGDRHPDTLTSIGNMGSLLEAQGQLDEARPLYEEALQGRREVLGDRDQDTLVSITNLADLLRMMGRLSEAEPMLADAMVAARETLGEDHLGTLVITAKMARVQHAQSGGAAAGKGLLVATVARMAEVLGDTHPQTSKYRTALDEME